MKQARIVILMLSLACLCSLAAASNPFDEFEHLTVPEMCSMLPADTIFLRPNTCNHWVRCSSGNNMEEGSCVNGLYYNKELGRCSLAENVVCPFVDLESPENTNPCATESDGTFLVDPKHCNGYIVCKSNVEAHGVCPNDLVFDPKSRSCVYSSEYTCPDAVAKTTSLVCRSLSNNTHLPHKEKCNKYYICINEVLQERECGINEAYDVVKGACEPIENVHCYDSAVLPEPESTICLNGTSSKALEGIIPDEESCNQYYICNTPVNGKHDTHPQRLQCDTDQFFDYGKLSCRERYNVKCSLDRCINSNLSYVHVNGDCQSYARCHNGVTASVARCPDHYFFDERNQGCTPDSHKSLACSS